MELFDVIKTVFKSDKDWSKVTRNEKVKNFFMLNRIMGIQFPTQANQFNHTKISPRPVADWWHSTLSRHYTKVPGWVFTKTKKGTVKSKASDKNPIDPAVEDFIMSKFEVSRREMDDLKKFYPEKYTEWINQVSEQIGLG
jgi:hypothetical protein